jgi:hypothetical protein
MTVLYGLEKRDADYLASAITEGTFFSDEYLKLIRPPDGNC